ncbi:MAG: extracellular solute-binding protein [Propionibacteriaceae bacterium]|nr:extracellular solute-binding protein [Propionibacteriaceae bacterium]
MQIRGLLAAAAAGALMLSACGGNEAADTDLAAPSAETESTLTVWLMDGSQPDSVVDAVNAEFKEKYPNVDVNVELQQWAGVQDKLTTSLNSTSTPDVVEIGNSLTAKFADAGLLSDLTDVADDLGADQWLPGLAPSGELDESRYGIPYYGGVRVVMYNKDHFKEAGVEVPTTLDELEQVAAKLAETKGGTDAGYSAFYFPGKFWYGALPFIWSEGGDIAVKDGDEWKGTLDSAESRAGLNRLKNIVDTYSTAPTDGNEVTNWEVFQEDNIGMVMDSWWAPGAVVGANEAFADKVGVFPLPGVDADKTAPAFFGGSDLAVPEKSDARGLAIEWTKILTSTEIQTQLAKEGGVIPNNEAAFVGHEGNDFLLAADEAAKVSAFTPVSPMWGNVEADAVLPDMLVKIFSGASSVEDATTEANAKVTEILNG